MSNRAEAYGTMLMVKGSLQKGTEATNSEGAPPFKCTVVDISKTHASPKKMPFFSDMGSLNCMCLFICLHT